MRRVRRLISRLWPMIALCSPGHALTLVRATTSIRTDQHRNRSTWHRTRGPRMSPARNARLASNATTYRKLVALAKLTVIGKLPLPLSAASSAHQRHIPPLPHRGTPATLFPQSMPCHAMPCHDAALVSRGTDCAHQRRVGRCVRHRIARPPDLKLNKRKAGVTRQARAARCISHFQCEVRGTGLG
ncbi:hypothetical protein EJ06DRAFT_78659 [Trichodelitschia bisporula]|uniref:Secreted protein n=1 Tax=Trichodelitschia bisporula TaxID=703511 RepID=A0A6G1HU63_9PEZI|nr:hypothetical protein EJ06DRAFT_78659 [Trichodelitschia bisporula]